MTAKGILNVPIGFTRIRLPEEPVAINISSNGNNVTSEI
jgi:hypothetical protein